MLNSPIIIDRVHLAAFCAQTVSRILDHLPLNSDLRNERKCLSDVLWSAAAALGDPYSVTDWLWFEEKVADLHGLHSRFLAMLEFETLSVMFAKMTEYKRKEYRALHGTDPQPVAPAVAAAAAPAPSSSSSSSSSTSQRSHRIMDSDSENDAENMSDDATPVKTEQLSVSDTVAAITTAVIPPQHVAHVTPVRQHRACLPPTPRKHHVRHPARYVIHPAHHPVFDISDDEKFARLLRAIDRAIARRQRRQQQQQPDQQDRALLKSGFQTR